MTKLQKCLPFSNEETLSVHTLVSSDTSTKSTNSLLICPMKIFKSFKQRCQTEVTLTVSNLINLFLTSSFTLTSKRRKHLCSIRNWFFFEHLPPLIKINKKTVTCEKLSLFYCRRDDWQAVVVFFFFNKQVNPTHVYDPPSTTLSSQLANTFGFVFFSLKTRKTCCLFLTTTAEAFFCFLAGARKLVTTFLCRTLKGIGI